MALSYKHDAIQWLAADAVNTTYTLTPGFTVKFIHVYWNGLQSSTDAASGSVSSNRGHGFATGTAARRCVGSFSQTGVGTSNCGTVAANDCVVVTTDGAGGIDAKLDLSVFNTDVTFIVDDVTPNNRTIFVEMWGGDDPTVFVVGDFAEPAAAGNQAYSAAGFVAGASDQCVMFAGVQSVAAINTAEAEASGMYFGIAAGTNAADNIVTAGNSDDASATMDTDGYAHTGECIALCAKAGAAVANARGTVNAWLTDQFQVNWLEVGVTSRKSIYLAIKGGSWTAGSLTIDMNTVGNTATRSGLPYTPVGMTLMWTGQAESAVDTFVATDNMGVGSGSSTTSRRSMATRDEDATASSNSEIDTVLEYDQVLCYGNSDGTSGRALDINSMNSDGWQLIVDVTAVLTAWVGYLTYGDAPPPSTKNTFMMTGVS